MADKYDEELARIFEEIVVESRAPTIGIWWLIDDKVVSFHEDLRDASAHGLMHMTSFPKLKLPGHYADYDRGRVDYNPDTKQFLLYCGLNLSGDKVTLAKVAKDFNLPIAKNRIKVITSQQYDIEPNEESLFDDEDEDLDDWDDLDDDSEEVW